MAGRSSPPPPSGGLTAAAAFYDAGRPKADSPSPPRIGWGRILANVWSEIGRDFVTVMAAGVAFFTFLSIFPAMTTMISAFGLVADPHLIERQFLSLRGMLPPEAMKLLATQLHALVGAAPGKLGIGLIVSLLITLWSASSGVSTLMQALTAAYEEHERRSIVAFYAEAFALTIGIGIFGLVSLLLIAIVPAVIGWLPFPESWQEGIAMIRWPILALLVYVALALVYRFAPSRVTPRWHWLGAGTIAATVIWLVGSAAFSFYVAQFSTYNKTYGSLGAVVVLMMWFYLGALVVLVGAEINSEADKAHAEDKRLTGDAPGSSRLSHRD